MSPFWGGSDGPEGAMKDWAGCFICLPAMGSSVHVQENPNAAIEDRYGSLLFFVLE